MEAGRDTAAVVSGEADLPGCDGLAVSTGITGRTECEGEGEANLIGAVMEQQLAQLHRNH